MLYVQRTKEACKEGMVAKGSIQHNIERIKGCK